MIFPPVGVEGEEPGFSAFSDGHEDGKTLFILFIGGFYQCVGREGVGLFAGRVVRATDK